MYFLTSQSTKGTCIQPYEADALVGVLLIKKQTEKKSFLSRSDIVDEIKLITFIKENIFTPIALNLVIFDRYSTEQLIKFPAEHLTIFSAEHRLKITELNYMKIASFL